MYLPLWKDTNINQKIISCVLGLLPSICEQMCAASSLLIVNHLNWSKQGGCFSVLVQSLCSDR